MEGSATEEMNFECEISDVLDNNNFNQGGGAYQYIQHVCDELCFQHRKHCNVYILHLLYNDFANIQQGHRGQVMGN